MLTSDLPPGLKLGAVQRDAVAAWTTRLLIAVNHLQANCAATPERACRAGPCTAAQSAAVYRLVSAAAYFVVECPETFEHHDWPAELAKKRVSYDGEEIATAERVTLEQVRLALPPRGVAASLDAAALSTGRVREALLAPDEMILPAEQLQVKVPRANDLGLPGRVVRPGSRVVDTRHPGAHRRR